MADDLDYNLFYKALQTKFPAEYQIAQNKCFAICIPQNLALEGVVIDKYFIDMHILRPSPFVLGQFLTTDKLNTCTVEEDNDKLFTKEGFKEEKSVKILAKEVGYNKSMKPFKIYILENALLCESDIKVEKKTPSTGGDKLSFDAFSPRVSYESCTDFLHSFEECQKAVAEIEEKVLLFCRTYMVLKGYLSDASQRLERLCRDCEKIFLAPVRQDLIRDARVKDNTRRAIDSFILGSCYDRVFPVICEEYSKKDAELRVKLGHMKGISAQQLGLHSQFSCSLSTPVTELEKLDDLKTPLEKLNCMKKTLDNITESVSQSPTVDLSCLTSDELIPLLVLVMCESQCARMASNLYYVENFHWSTSSTDDLSYSCVTFQAAMHYILSVKLSDLHLEHQGKKQRQVPDSGISTNNVTPDSSSALPPKQPTRRINRLDRQLDRITKMLEASTEDFAKASNISDPGRGPTSCTGSSYSGSRRKKDNSDLGEFLTALQDDVLDSSGKQT